LLRKWSDEDLDPFVALCSDPRVMQYVVKPRDRAAVSAWIDDARSHFDQFGYGMWVIELVGISKFIGFTGLKTVSYQAHFTPAVEIAWRLASSQWGRGYATEAATLALDFGFGELMLDEIVANTASDNWNSRRVMVRLGMKRDPRDDFDHPLMPDGDTLKRQVLYRLQRTRWLMSRRDQLSSPTQI